MPAPVSEPEARTLGVTCPACRSDEATVSLNLDTMLCSCSDCDDEFTAESAALQYFALAERWRQVADWIAGAPTL